MGTDRRKRSSARNSTAAIRLQERGLVFSSCQRELCHKETIEAVLCNGYKHSISALSEFGAPAMSSNFVLENGSSGPWFYYRETIHCQMWRYSTVLSGESATSQPVLRDSPYQYSHRLTRVSSQVFACFHVWHHACSPSTNV